MMLNLTKRAGVPGLRFASAVAASAPKTAAPKKAAPSEQPQPFSFHFEWKL